MIYTAIDTFYLTAEQLNDSPTRRDGVEADTEYALRVYGCELIQEAGILLNMTQAVMATGQVLLHRFYCKKSFTKFNVKRVAASCLWLAAKLEEQPRKSRDLLNVFHRLNQRREKAPGEPMEALEPLSRLYEEMKTDLIRTERHLLKEMGFICHVEHPHKFILQYLDQLLVEDAKVRQEAWSLANDSLRTTLCVRFKSEVVACGVIYIATRRAGIPLPEQPPWWAVFDASWDKVLLVAKELSKLYSLGKPKYIDVSTEQKSFVLSTRAWD
jgi:hypothetical protein